MGFVVILTLNYKQKIPGIETTPRSFPNPTLIENQYAGVNNTMFNVLQLALRSKLFLT